MLEKDLIKEFDISELDWLSDEMGLEDYFDKICENAKNEIKRMQDELEEELIVKNDWEDVSDLIFQLSVYQEIFNVFDDNEWYIDEDDFECEFDMILKLEELSKKANPLDYIYNEVFTQVWCDFESLKLNEIKNVIVKGE